jgi:hypothetical protein
MLSVHDSTDPAKDVGVIVSLYYPDRVEGKNNIFYYHDAPTVKGSLQQPGRLLDSGNSEVTAMIWYNKGILVAFKNVENRSDLHRVHSCESFKPLDFLDSGKSIGRCRYSDIYTGGSPVAAMLPYNDGTHDGVLTAFLNNNQSPDDHVVYFSKDGTNLGAGDLKYPIRRMNADAPVVALAARGTEVLAAFSTWQRVKRIMIQSSQKRETLSAGSNVYEYPR